MKEPSAATLAAYEAALPADSRIERKKMFGMPCAFVNRQMFFGIFDDSLVARIGPARVRALEGQGGSCVFTPTEGKTWADYLQFPSTTKPEGLKGLANEALNWTTKLPPKAKPPKEERPRSKKPKTPKTTAE